MIQCNWTMCSKQYSLYFYICCNLAERSSIWWRQLASCYSDCWCPLQFSIVCVCFFSQEGITFVAHMSCWLFHSFSYLVLWFLDFLSYSTILFEHDFFEVPMFDFGSSASCSTTPQGMLYHDCKCNFLNTTKIH